MITAATIIALVTLFLHACTWPGMIFGLVSNRLAGLPAWLQKPLYDCPVCMAIWWGPAVLCVCILGGFVPFTSVWLLFITLAMAGGMNAVLAPVISYTRGKKCNCERKERLNLLPK